MSFMSNVKDTLVNNEEFNYSVTENGALGYRTTGKSLLDFSFKISSFRSASAEEILNEFYKVWNDSDTPREITLRYLFYVRDIRGGLGERSLFRIILISLAITELNLVVDLVPLIAEYGRWDDLLVLLHTTQAVEDKVISVIKNQLAQDEHNYSLNQPISLLAKWMPSINTSSDSIVSKAKYLAKKLNMTPRVYRKLLSKLRKALNIVETNLTEKNYTAINYEQVPSYANLKYKNAFARNDGERYHEYLENVAKGANKINAGVLYPHDIVHKYYQKYGQHISLQAVKDGPDPTLEALWVNLPNVLDQKIADKIANGASTLVVADGSGSMITRVGNTSVTALEIANGLAIYFAERAHGEFHNTYITFSSFPQIVNLPGTSLLANLIEAGRHAECANTDIKKTFDLILSTAKEHHMSQEELPKNLLIISDMEFDSATILGYGGPRNNQKLMNTIKDEFEAAGYKMPRLIFWNVYSRTNTIPIKENELGVTLLSGFSVNLFKMVLSNELDPYNCLLDTLLVDRYDAVEEAYRTSISF